MRPVLSLAAVSLAALSLSPLSPVAPAFAQTTPPAATAPRAPTGALVPDPAATPGTSRNGAVAPNGDPVTTGTIQSRDTIGLPQSPERRNVMGCKQIDPLCQEQPARAP